MVRTTHFDKCIDSLKRPALKLQQVIFVLFILLYMFALAGCSSSTDKGPKSMPTPEANVEPLLTVGPTVTANPDDIVKTTETDAGPEDTDITNDNTEAANVEVENPNGSKVVVLDPGHGGKFTGAIYFGQQEKDMTLKVANYIRDYLTTNYENIEVYLTRETDIALDPDIKIELEQRAEVAKEYNADFFVSLHFNASEEHNLNGATVYASFRDNVGEGSQGIAASILNELVTLGLKNNNVKTRVSKDYFAEDGSRLDYYAVIRHSALRDIPGVIVEHCFMDNEIDKAYIDTEEKLQALAEADAKGIAKYLELKVKE